MRVASYVRVSTPHQVQLQTIEQQLTRLQSYVGQQGWAWDQVQVFRDDGYSGASLQRPGLDQLRDQARAGQFDTILLTAPDRLARNYVHQMLLVEEFEKDGCEVVFVDRPLSKDPNDQLLLQIRGAVAEYERTLITERMRRGRLHKYQTGQLLPWTIAPYGYLSDPDQPRRPEGVRLEPVQAAVVSQMVADYLAPGGTLCGVAKRLTAAHIPSPTGKPYWSPQSVRCILTNPVYVGQVYAQRSHPRTVKRKRSPLIPAGRRRADKQFTSREDWVLVGHVPAIMSPAQFEQVQAKLKLNQQQAFRNNKAHTYLLRALVSCGLCRRTCRGQTRRRYAYYQCAGKDHIVLSGRPERCSGRLIPMQQLDALVWTDLCQILQNPSLITQALQRVQAGLWLPQELRARRANLQHAQQALTNQIDRLTDAYLAGIVELQEYQRRRHDLQQRLAAFQTQEQALTYQGNRQVELAGWVTHLEAFCQRIQTGLAAATFQEKRQLVELLIDRVIVTNDDVEIRYVFPTDPRSEHLRFCLLRLDYCRTFPAHAERRMSGKAPSGNRRRDHALSATVLPVV